MKYLLKYLLLFTFLQSAGLTTYCQKFQSDSIISKNQIEVKFSCGKLLPHHQEMQILSEGYITAAELSIGKYSNGSKSWHKAYNYPAYGITYQFMNLGSKTYLGTSHGVLPYISFSTSPYKENFKLLFRIAGGINFVTKKYDEITNPKNVSISTSINSDINFSTEAEYLLNQSLVLKIGVRLNHISNGNFKKPNYGLNFISFGGGVSQNFGKTKMPQSISVNGFKNVNRFNLLGIFSIKEEKDPGGPKFNVFSGSIEYSHCFNEFIRFNTLIDVMQDKSMEYVLDYDNIYYDSNLELLKLGASIQPEFVLDRLSFILGLGIYAFNKNPNNGILYQRIGVRYRLTPMLWTHLALKTHWNIADYIELGLLVSIWKSKT